METKAQLRNRLLVWRKGLSGDDHSVWSREITRKILSWSVYQNATTIHCFRSMARTGEVETGPLIEQMLRDGKRVVVPRTGAKGMASVRIENDTVFERHALGMEEPTTGEVIPDGEIDLVLVPLLAADRTGHRLGYGKGMYDRFLSGLSSVNAGLLFAPQLQDQPLPADPHDVPLDWLVTEESILKCES
ncbi:MAG: 5-formyltetrahydrofolate cyclo-ligase [Balneolaceae bacterium]